MKVFITGATGFIGRNLIRKLIGRGDEVVALVRRPDHRLPPEVKTICGDILSVESWKDSVKGCRRLYHLAAIVSFDPAKRKQLLSINGQGTYNVLEAASQTGIESSVVVSSACTMGLSYKKDTLLDEDSPLDEKLVKDNPYLESKLAAEKAALGFSARHKVVVVNPTTVYGPGDWTLNSGTLIKKIATSRILPVPAGGGNVVDVEDVAEGIFLAGEHGLTANRYIIGGENLSFKEIFTVISDVVRNKPFFIPVPSSMRLPLSLAIGAIGSFINSRFLTRQIVSDTFFFKYYSLKKAQSQLEFKARYSFYESIARAWSFYRENGLMK